MLHNGVWLLYLQAYSANTSHTHPLTTDAQLGWTQLKVKVTLTLQNCRRAQTDLSAFLVVLIFTDLSADRTLSEQWGPFGAGLQEEEPVCTMWLLLHLSSRKMCFRSMYSVLFIFDIWYFNIFWGYVENNWFYKTGFDWQVFGMYIATSQKTVKTPWNILDAFIKAQKVIWTAFRTFRIRFGEYFGHGSKRPWHTTKDPILISFGVNLILSQIGFTEV